MFGKCLVTLYRILWIASVSYSTIFKKCKCIYSLINTIFVFVTYWIKCLSEMKDVHNISMLPFSLSNMLWCWNVEREWRCICLLQTQSRLDAPPPPSKNNRKWIDGKCFILWIPKWQWFNTSKYGHQLTSHLCCTTNCWAVNEQNSIVNLYPCKMIGSPKKRSLLVILVYMENTRTQITLQFHTLL